MQQHAKAQFRCSSAAFSDDSAASSSPRCASFCGSSHSRGPSRQTCFFRLSRQNCNLANVKLSCRLRRGSAICTGSNRRHLKCLASLAQNPLMEGKGWDILGLGQAMVDFSAAVDDDFLREVGIEKGGRRIISLEERTHLLERLDGQYQINAGGSLANTLATLGRLSSASESDPSGRTPPLRVAAASLVGGDALGTFHSAQQQQAGVTTLSQPFPDSCTGTVIVLTTSDANRTFLSYLGTPQALSIDGAVSNAICCSRIVLIEGYIWETPSAVEQIEQIVALAHQSGSLVGMTAGDANVVNRHYSDIWRVLSKGIDILFANRQEAQALVKCQCTAEEAALRLGPYSGVVVITDGANGSSISAMGSLKVVPPFWSTQKPTDTCGAGDAYAAGFLHGFLNGLDPASMGGFGARVASTVIAKQGSTISEAEAGKLLQKIPSVKPMAFLNSGFSGI